MSKKKKIRRSRPKTKSTTQARIKAADLSVDEALDMARQVHQAGRLDEAEKVYRHVLKQIPEHPHALNFLAILTYQRGNIDDAVGLLKRAIAVTPDNADLHNNFGNLLKMQTQPEAAIKAYEKAIMLNPKQTDAFYNLGTLLAGKNRLSEAIDAFRNALNLNQDYIEAYTGLGSALHRFGQLDEAAAIYRQLLEKDPEHPIAEHMLSVCTGENVPERASDAYVQSLFDSFAEDFDKKLAGLKYRAPQLISDAIAARFPHAEKQFDILDAGSGTGLCGPLLNPYARYLVGIDLSPEMLKKADGRCYDQLVEAELVAFMQKHPEFYDLIVSADTLVYFGALQEAIQSAADALRVGGFLFFSVEQYDVQAQTPTSGYAITESGRYCHSRDYVSACLNDAGLAIDAIHDVHLRLESGRPVLGMLVIAQKKPLAGETRPAEN